jgi:hypothetical protein
VLVAFAAMPGLVRGAPLPGPSSLSAGFGDSQSFESDPPSARETWFTRAQRLGARWVRLDVTWSSIAPARLTAGFAPTNPGDPRYSWSAVDAAVRTAAGHGQSVLLQIVSAPAWAEGRNPPRGVAPGSWRPSAAALGQFARALARRYSGHFRDPERPGTALPRVTHFLVWNEPNLPLYLSPQWSRTRRGTYVPASPAIYRGLLNAAYRNIKSVQPHAYIIAGATAPYGDPPGRDRMGPALFIRELLCLHGPALRPASCPHPAHLDALDHHPYALSPTLPAFNADDVSVPDLGKLTRVLRAARLTHRVLPAGPKQLWVTEIEWDSSPPDASGVSLATQARYLSLAFYEVWRQGVMHVFWFGIGDHRYLLTVNLTGIGVYFANGTPKPAAAAFRFPFVATRTSARILTIWGRAPVAGGVTIELLRGRGWRPVARLATTRGGVFYTRLPHRGRATLRAVIRGLTSNPFSSA